VKQEGGPRIGEQCTDFIPFGEHCLVVSIYGADLEDNKQAEKLKQAFVDCLIEILALAIAEVHKKIEEKFAMDKFTIENAEKFSPLNQMNMHCYAGGVSCHTKSLRPLQLTICTSCA
jgi:hypothetical protein